MSRFIKSALVGAVLLLVFFAGWKLGEDNGYDRADGIARWEASQRDDLARSASAAASRTARREGEEKGFEAGKRAGRAEAAEEAAEERRRVDAGIREVVRNLTMLTK